MIAANWMGLLRRASHSSNWWHAFKGTSDINDPNWELLLKKLKNTHVLHIDWLWVNHDFTEHKIETWERKPWTVLFQVRSSHPGVLLTLSPCRMTLMIIVIIMNENLSSQTKWEVTSWIDQPKSEPSKFDTANLNTHTFGSQTQPTTFRIKHKMNTNKRKY